MMIAVLAVLPLLALAAPPSASATQPIWVYLQEAPAGAIDPAQTPLTQRALERRALRRTLPGLVDARDLPIDEATLAHIRATGATVRQTSRWLRAVSVDATPAQMRALRALPEVRTLAPVARGTRRDGDAGKRFDPAEGVPEGLAPAPASAASAIAAMAPTDYGASFTGLDQIQVPALHARGFAGAGIVIGILDTGFNRVHEAFHSAEHPLTVLAEWDFVDHDPNTAPQAGDPGGQHNHGTWILGTLAAYLPGTLLGTAYEAHFVLAKTEIVPVEIPVEEDNYVAGIEFIEAQGADISTSSLGYIDWYSQAQLDGHTAVTTVAVNLATANGVVCLTAAGNQGHDGDPATNHLLAPADALEVLSIGAAHSDGSIASFSSDGPSADGRVKPELLALGVSVPSVHTDDTTGLQWLSGTSLATPLAAGAMACVLEARPDLRAQPVSALRTAAIATATESAGGTTFDPLYIRGYGFIQADAIARRNRSVGDLNVDGIVDGADLGLMLGMWGSCANVAGCVADLNHDGVVDGADLGLLLGSWGN
ncbi:MAG: S8 family serine peptidase [Phycisphaerales bacterium]